MLPLLWISFGNEIRRFRSETAPRSGLIYFVQQVPRTEKFPLWFVEVLTESPAVGRVVILIYKTVSVRGYLVMFLAGLDVLEMIPGRLGVPKSRLSGFQKFEAPDPAKWTGRGYAIVNPDARGAYDSEGDLRQVSKWCCSLE